MPLVSVVIPVFNSERYIADAVDSVLHQTYPSIEVIVVDDGSSDSSLEILSRYGDAIRLIRQRNAGPARARNVGIGASRGTYIAFLDADDLWHPDKVRMQIDHFLAREDVGLVYNRWLVVEDDSSDALVEFRERRFDDQLSSIDENLSGTLYSALLLDCVVHTSSAMVRKSLLDRGGGFDETLRKGQDYDLWLRLSQIATFLKLTPVLSIYRVHGSGVTGGSTPVNYPAEVVSRAVARWGLEGPDGSAVSRLAMRRRFSRLWLDFASLHVDAGNGPLARESIWRSVRYAPWNLGPWKLFVRSRLMATDPGNNGRRINEP